MRLPSVSTDWRSSRRASQMWRPLLFRSPRVAVLTHLLSCLFLVFLLVSSKLWIILDLFIVHSLCSLWALKNFHFWCILVVFVERDELSLPDPLASWSSLDLFIYSSLFSKSLRIFNENSGVTNNLLFGIFQLCLSWHPGFDAKESRIRRSIPKSKPRKYEAFHPQKFAFNEWLGNIWGHMKDREDVYMDIKRLRELYIRQTLLQKEMSNASQNCGENTKFSSNIWWEL